ncbi:MAG: type IV toxin-antitoxin system AbiEi family antitoxin domain-containing protein [Actinobacteria bacterium]|nr:type IV toxin-antitoxin system AbiEi family antitoxin domain-containing protein [Actinomycetota bacterium]
MATKSSWQKLMKLARRQHGLVTVAQAEEVGIPRSTLSRWVAAGRLKRWYPGVYALEGVPDSWLRRAKAATLAAHAEAVLGGAAAARLHGLLAFDGSQVELLVPRTAACGRLGRVAIRRTSTLPDHHRVEVDGVPAASVARTIVELVDVVAEKRLREVLLDAWRRNLVTPLEVAACLGEVGRVRGAARLRRVLAECDPALARTRSIAEIVGYLAIRDAGLPVPEVNHRVEVAGRRYEIDLAWPELERGVEIDEEAFHSIPPDVAADARRQADLEGAGWRLDRAPARLVLTDPAAFVAQVRDLLASAQVGAPE